jgi:ubiquinone biosynthesis protein COQ4
MATALESQTVTPLAPAPFQARLAFRLLRELLRNPQDTDKVFEFFEAVGGEDDHFVPFLADPDGRRLLATRPQLVEVLADEAYLESLPVHSLGGWYLRFMRARGFAPAGLLEARDRGAQGRPFRGAEREWFSDRLNVMHDLWHVLTGYGTDEMGESALLAFSQAQIPNRSFLILIAAAIVKGPKSLNLAWPRYLWSAYRRSRKAKLLTAAPYEELLPLPVPEVRARLGIGPAAEWHTEGIVAGTLFDSAEPPAA